MAEAPIQKEIAACTKCSRLIPYCQEIAREKRKAFLTETYWGKPVPSFGNLSAELVIVGLAPAAHGANRTGRMFTGDRSGEWLYRALHRAGFASQPTSTHRDDSLRLINTYITAVVKCAPPDNKPTLQEITTCSEFLKREILLLKKAKVYIALGQIAFNGVWPLIEKEKKKKPKFAHGTVIELSSGKTLILSYHPSQQNTFTGRLTEPMFDFIFNEARSRLI